MLEVVAEEKTKEGVQKKVGKNNPRTSDKDYLVQSHRPPEHYVRMLTGNKVNSKVQLLTKLQQTYGNRYVQRVMAKLKIGQPNDKYEQEADRIAQQVVSSQSAFCEKKAEEKLQGRIEEEEKKKKEEEIMTKRTSEGKITDDFEKSLYRSRGMGKSLPADIRTFMEERFGVDFGDVRIHTDTNAALMAEALNAEAFTYGRDIYFGAGKYKPETTEGKKLLAHELVHVVQQAEVLNTTRVNLKNIENIECQLNSINHFISRIQGKSLIQSKTRNGRERDAQGRRLHSSGIWTGNTTLIVQGGQGMHFVIKNLNILGTTISITANTGEYKASIIPPLGTVDFLFTCFGAEPMGWKFDVQTESDVFLVGWKLYSTWIPGDPPNR